MECPGCGTDMHSLFHSLGIELSEGELASIGMLVRLFENCPECAAYQKEKR